MIALVTCYFQHNYGSQLQALATEMAMEKLGLEYETIRIDGLRPEINRAKYRYFISKILDVQTIKDKMATVRKVIAKKTNKEYRSNLALRDKLFSRFSEEMFHLSKQYNSKTELTLAAGNYDAFLVGSDQLWLPSNIAADYYTLNFVPDYINKVAYATSFGVKHLPSKYAQKAQYFLNRLDRIMVREIAGQQLVKELTNKDVPVVADPTLLFTAEEWEDKLSGEREELRGKEENANKYGNYVLCYFLGNNTKHRQYAKLLAKERGLKIVQLPHLDEYVKSDEGFADFALYEVNPLDFVDLIRKASYVLTDSFHCTVFSNLFQKEYRTFRRYKDDGSASTNSRLYSLLDTLGESYRMVDDEEENAVITTGKLQLKECNKKEGNSSLEIIAKLREESFELLKSAL